MKKIRTPSLHLRLPFFLLHFNFNYFSPPLFNSLPHNGGQGRALRLGLWAAWGALGVSIMLKKVRAYGRGSPYYTDKTRLNLRPSSGLSNDGNETLLNLSCPLSQVTCHLGPKHWKMRIYIVVLMFFWGILSLVSKSFTIFATINIKNR